MIDKEFSQDKIFLHMDKLGDFVKGENVTPVVIETNITNRCNANCKWCSELSYRERHQGEMIDKDIMLSMIESAGKTGVRSLVFEGGGEPTVHPNLMEFVKATNRVGMDAGLITNGMILNKAGVIDQIDLFKFVRVSLDAGTDKTYSNLHGVSRGWFDHVIHQINLMKIQKDKVGADTVIGISFIVTEENVDEAEMAAELVKSAGADYIQFKAEIYEESFRIPIGAKDKIDEVKKKFESEDFKVFSVRLDGRSAGGIKDYPFCFAHRFIGAMTANGQIQLCCNLKHEYDDRFSFGSLYENTFEEIWNSERRQRLVDAVEKDPNFVRTHCGQCRMDNINRVFNWIKGYGGMKNFI